MEENNMMTTEGKERIYISGQISGLPIDDAIEKFEDAKNRLSDRYDVIIPFDNGLSNDEPKEKHLDKDLSIIKQCDAIYMLKGWAKSEGASIEYLYAKYNNKKIYFEETKEDNFFLSVILSYFKINYDDFVGRSRKRDLCCAREIFIFFCRKRGYTLEKIGSLIKRSHCTVSHYLLVYDNDISCDMDFKKMVREINMLIEI